MCFRRVALVRSLVMTVASVALVATALGAVPGEEFEKLAAAAREHRAALARLLALQEQDLGRATDDVARLRALLARELVARRDLENAEHRHAALGADVMTTRIEATRVESVIADALAAAALARIPPPGPGEERTTRDVIAFGGRGGWSLARLSSVERFFAGRFGRALPVSAVGQTPVHDRFGFDHRHAVDLAIHPDTPEGRALIAFLKAEGIPFLAFRGAEPGASTGAHVHVGEPSLRKPVARAR